jgi:hypothetical protein
MKTIEKTIVREVQQKGIKQVITLALTIYSAEEAIRLYNLGYLDETTLHIAGIHLPDVPEKGDIGYDVDMRFKIEKAVMEYFGYDLHSLASKYRGGKLVLARQLTTYLLRKHTGFSFKQIGERYGDRSHTTIMHGCNNIKDDLASKGDCARRNLINDFLIKYEF